MNAQLINNLGENLSPKTTTADVVDSSGKRLDAIIDELKLGSDMTIESKLVNNTAVVIENINDKLEYVVTLTCREFKNVSSKSKQYVTIEQIDEEVNVLDTCDVHVNITKPILLHIQPSEGCVSFNVTLKEGAGNDVVINLWNTNSSKHYIHLSEISAEVTKSLYNQTAFNRDVLDGYNVHTYVKNNVTYLYNTTERLPVSNCDKVLVFAQEAFNNAIVKAFDENGDEISVIDNDTISGWKGAITLDVAGAKYLEVRDLPFKLINTNAINNSVSAADNSLQFDGFVLMAQIAPSILWNTYAYPYIGNGIYVEKHAQQNYTLTLFVKGQQVYSTERWETLWMDDDEVKRYGAVDSFTISHEKEDDKGRGEVPQVYISKYAYQLLTGGSSDATSFESQYKDKIEEFEALEKPDLTALRNTAISASAEYVHVRTQAEFDSLFTDKTVLKGKLAAHDVVVVIHEGIYQYGKRNRISVSDLTTANGLWIKAATGERVRMIPYECVLEQSKAESRTGEHWVISDPFLATKHTAQIGGKDVDAYNVYKSDGSVEDGYPYAYYGFRLTDMIVSEEGRIKESYANDVASEGDVYSTGAFAKVASSQMITITKAPAASGVITLKVNGVTYSVNYASGDTMNDIASRIASLSMSGFSVVADGNKVTFTSTGGAVDPNVSFTAQKNASASAYDVTATIGAITLFVKAKLPTDVVSKIPTTGLEYSYIYYTASYLPQLESITKIEDGYVYFWTKGRIEFDNTFSGGKCQVRFLLVNIPTLLQKDRYTYAGGKYYIPNSVDKVYIAHEGCVRWLETKNVVAKIVSVDGIEFVGAPATKDQYYNILFFRQTGNVVVTNCYFKGVMKNTCISTAVSGNGELDADNVKQDFPYNCLVADCEFEDIKWNAMKIQNQRSVVTRCKCHDAWELAWGNSGSMIMVSALDGLISWNKVWNFKNTAIRYFGQDRDRTTWTYSGGKPVIVENNEIWNDYDRKKNHYRLSLMDFGAIYGHKNGNCILRYNYIHDVQGMYAGCGIYLDDGQWNTKVYGNVILHTTAYSGNTLQKKAMKKAGDSNSEHFDSENFFVNNILDGGYCMESWANTQNNWCGANLFIRPGSKLSNSQVMRTLIKYEEDDYLSQGTYIDDGIIYSKTALPDYLGGLLKRIWRTIG